MCRWRSPFFVGGLHLYLLGALTFAINGSVSKVILLSGSTLLASQLRVTGAFLILLAFIVISRPRRL